MKKNVLSKSVDSLLWSTKGYDAYKAKTARVKSIIDGFESRISGKLGAEDARDRLYAELEKLYVKTQNYPAITYPTPEARQKARLKAWKKQSAETLAAKANLRSDEHGSHGRGDHLTVYGLDYVGPWESAATPYWDMGGEGLGLVEVTRTRVYAKSCSWGPSSVSTTFLVGRNEAGTYFSHPVSPNCRTIIDALQWIWSGKAYQIIQRQGDIALIGGNGGPKLPARLPAGHYVHGDIITHATHPDLPMPANKGERIIIARRAAERASEATRD